MPIVLKHRIHDNIIVYVSARDGHVLRRFGNNDNIRSVARFNICGFKNNAEKVIMIHSFVGVWAERNKSILAIHRRNNIILCSLAQYCHITFSISQSSESNLLFKNIIIMLSFIIIKCCLRCV